MTVPDPPREIVDARYRLDESGVVQIKERREPALTRALLLVHFCKTSLVDGSTNAAAGGSIFELSWGWRQ